MHLIVVDPAQVFSNAHTQNHVHKEKCDHDRNHGVGAIFAFFDGVICFDSVELRCVYICDQRCSAHHSEGHDLTKEVHCSVDECRLQRESQLCSVAERRGEEAHA